MLPPRAAIGRIPGASLSLRPQSHHGLRQPFRPFTHNSRLSLVSTPLGRPQLPFLSPLTSTRPQPPLSSHLRQHFARLISTESRNYYRRRISRGLRIGLSFYAILVMFQVMKLGVYQEQIEHAWPTPPEWSWKSRWCLRSAQAQQNPEQIGHLLASWPMVAGYLRALIERLEDPEIEGKGIIEQDDGGILIEGVGKTGFDVSAKSEPWRRGYHQALMGAARAAENLDGWMTDRKQRVSAPAEYVVGPSNPRPKPMPAHQKKTLHEEDCEPASPGPESFYMKILTTRGFDTRQKLDAALAYADWLEYKGLHDTASDMYTWAMDIATSASPIEASKVVDLKTGILKNDGQHLPSENIMRVSTALAVHHARQKNLPVALSLFTSVLKARRALPPAEPGTVFPTAPSIPKSRDPFRAVFNAIKTMLIPVEYPAPLPSGDETPVRSPTASCDEAGLMTYIGEILFASSSQETGLAWTRDAVDTAEATILDLGGPESPNAQRCTECLRVGLTNWKTMVAQLLAQAKKDETESLQAAEKSWFGGQKRAQAKALERKRWDAEKLILDDRFNRIWPALDGDSGLGSMAPNSSLFT